MSASGKTTRTPKTKTRKPPPRWRRFLVQAELELPPPSSHAPAAALDPDASPPGMDPPDTPWWRSTGAVLGLALACALLLVVTGVALRNGARDREAAAAAEERAATLTLRAVNSERTLRIAPNPGSWSASADSTIAWPQPPQLLELHFPVGYTQYRTFALVVDKVDHGRVMVIERLAPDSNRDLRLSINSSAFGPGEYRMRIQGYTWRGERNDVGWVRLVV
ncbi:MAG TPA: hypothetical protein VFI92_05785, partial [Steroidobacteraceae bacterium]|nr:hypothetical protein [Steroidobacteraceae bacterium]